MTLYSTIEQTAAATCNYCGRENPDRLPTCIGCGTPLASVTPSAHTEPKGRSKVLAVCLALIFGPLGLFYVEAWGPAFVMILVGAPFILTHTGDRGDGGIAFLFHIDLDGSRVVCQTSVGK